jgi:hypothetical protein
MEPLEDLPAVLQALQDGDAVRIPDGTVFFLKDGCVWARNPSARYRLSPKDFAELFAHQSFTRWHPEKETVDADKDEEYYQWKQKGFH